MKKFLSKDFRTGQNMIEYMLVFAGVVVVLVALTGPNGILTKRIDESLDMATKGARCMAVETCYDPAGCPAVCGNGCCETGSETAGNCSEDCECSTDADCDDGLFCNGPEQCNTAASICLSGLPPAVGDSNPCTVDACSEGSGITHTPDNSRCDDGLGCNGVETCNAASGCQAGTPIPVDDGDACTVDQCVEPGQVIHTPNSSCSTPAVGCGNGTCDGNEHCLNCSRDCGTCCGDGICAWWEGCELCPQDCGGPCSSVCGDGNCDANESCTNCVTDCQTCCGDGYCLLGLTEDCGTCPSDCGTCPACGNNSCEKNLGETCLSCPLDCNPCCGDGSCGYNYENCLVCEDDCGICSVEGCGNGFCQAGETCENCYQDCPSCSPGECGNGVCEPPETFLSCQADCSVFCGDGQCTGGGWENCTLCPSDCGVCPGSCGNRVCDPPSENIITCPQDCGASCGDGRCENYENCDTCPGDCGACPPGVACGNGICEAPYENCIKCSKDCPGCCPDGACLYWENCNICPADCGTRCEDNQASCLTQALPIGSGLAGIFTSIADGGTRISPCPAGYTGSPTRTCINGSWGGLNNGCLGGGDCPTQELPIGAGLTGIFTSTANGQTVTLSCPANYTGSPSRTCSNGNWGGLNNGCLGGGDCPTQTLPIGSGLYGIFALTADGETRTLTCQSGYAGSPNRTCINGSWGGLSDGCVPADCSTQTLSIGAGLNGTFTSTANGQTVTLGCPADYAGSPSRTCSYGRWGALMNGCVSSICPTMSLSIGSGVSGIFTTIADGETRTVTCPVGYMGSPSRTCNNGNWGGLSDGCVPGDCPTETLSIGSGLNGVYTTIADGETRTLTCPAGYTGSPNRPCSYGRWGVLSNGCVPICPNNTAFCCAQDGGSWEDSQSMCYFAGSSCTGGWSQVGNYSSTSSNSGSGTCARGSGPFSCSTGGHDRINAPIESCRYTAACGVFLTIYATQTEVGCAAQVLTGI